MNCEQFAQHLHRCLDERSEPNADRLLQQHAQQCDTCAADLRHWQQIDSVLRPAAVEDSAMPREMRSTEVANAGSPLASSAVIPREAVHRQGTYLTAIASLAAGLLLMIAWVERPGGSLPLAQLPDGSMQSNTTMGAASAVITLNQTAAVDPAAWWHGMQTTDWLGRTLPAVKSVQEGVAPLGRSLRQAVTILTIGGSDKTS